MPGSFRPKNGEARSGVFISYSRSDGAEFAEILRTRLEGERIPLWQDRIGMEGGRDWWLQVKDALDRVEFMVLVMTPAVLRSKTVRDEWRYARQQGVCVYPVKAEPNIESATPTQPRWMRDAHIYDLELEWNKFLNDLNTRCQTPRVPFMVEDLPEDFVNRSSELDQLASYLLDHEREEPVAITAALRGAGGYGKTTLAKALCHREDVRNAFDDGVLWVTLGEDPGDLTGRVEDLIKMLSREKPDFAGREAAVALLVELLADRDVLIVIDDVWNGAHLRPFLQGGERCARLITTRDYDTLPPKARRLNVDAMKLTEATALLGTGLPGGNESELRKLAARLGEWPLLLKLANGILRHRVHDTLQAMTEALVYANADLDENGLVAFDADASKERERAVASTLGVSLKLLSENERACYDQLAVFPEDVDIPLATIERLWSHSAGLSRLKTEKLCDRLSRLSLLLRFDPTTRHIRLHDVLRKYLTQQQRGKLAAMHSELLDAHRSSQPLPGSLPTLHSSGDWAAMPANEPYLWKYLAYHLVEAQRGEELLQTVTDLRYLARKTWVSKAPAAEADLIVAEKQTGSDPVMRLLRRSFGQCGHILNRCGSVQEVEATLYGRLRHLDDLAPLNRKLQQKLTLPYLEPWHLLQDLPGAAFVRTLAGHTGWVTHCAISADGSFIVSSSADGTLRVWDASSGTERFTLAGHTGRWVMNCAISADGSFIVSASEDQTLIVWDASSGTERFTLAGHTDVVNHCAISADGSFIVSASLETLKVWDSSSGTERFTLAGHYLSGEHCAISADGSFIVSATWQGTLKVWDASSGAERFTLAGHAGRVKDYAISADSSFIVSASDDQTLKVWDVRNGTLVSTFYTDKRLFGCACFPDQEHVLAFGETAIYFLRLVR